MESISQFFHSLTSADGIRNLVVQGGYVVLTIIIFSENGLLVGFFLPGDSLLITAGILIGSHAVDLSFALLALLLIAAAIIGEMTGYFIGLKAGEKLYQRQDSRLFKREHLLRAHSFYKKHGGKTIVFARFIPIVRTFVPVVAGAAKMDAKRFALFNIIGAVVWILAGLLLGMLLGQTVKNIGDYLYLVILIVAFISMLPPLIEWLRSRRREKLRIKGASKNSEPFDKLRAGSGFPSSRE